MPVRAVPLTDDAAHILLEGIVDYAGLFPPASQSMTAAVRAYAHHRASGAGWMLGRFVCPANRLDEFSKVADPLLPRDAGAIPWRITVVGSGDVAADMAAMLAFNERHLVCFDDRGAVADAYETKVASLDAVYRLDATTPRDLAVYLETPLGDGMDAILSGIARTGRRAKIRTGGVTADAFPSADQVVAFLAGCLRHGIVAKATAGLHHPTGGMYTLTYDEGAESGRMYGFLNVFLAAALLLSGGTAHEATLLLLESDRAAFDTNDLHAGWHGPDQHRTFDRALLQRVRQSLLTSFGSCSFTEPVEESRQLGFL